MKILYAPYNIASMPSITAQAMNKIDDVTAISISINENKYSTNLSSTIELKIDKKNIFTFFLSKLNIYYTLLRYILWADVIHWTWRSGVLHYNLDLFLIKLLKKKAYIEWVGSDIRVPEVLMKINEEYKLAFYNGYEYKNGECIENSYLTQSLFKKMNFIPILVPEMKLYLKPSLFDIVYNVQYRISTSKIRPVYPKLSNSNIKIIHSPSARYAKGSNYIESVINKLKLKYKFEYIELHNLPHSEVLRIMKSADIFIDQIILGSYAMAAMEAMCYGKPVLAYIMPSLYKKGIPEDCPIVNVTKDTLEMHLEKLISNPFLRNSIGVKSRQFVESNHDSEIISNYLYQIYKN